MSDEEPSPGKKSASARGGLHVGEIVAAAIAIADERGLGLLSMRHVADRLGCGVMSLYRHVTDKDHLIGLAIDAVYAEEPFPDPPPAGWRARMHESAQRQWRCYARHPWIVSLISLVRPRLGPNGMREMEWAFEGLQDLGVTSGERLHLFLVVRAFVHGAAAQAVVEVAEERRTGLDARDWWRAQSAELGDIFATGHYPVISRMGPDADPSPDAWFELGLSSLLDGLQLRFDQPGT